METAQAGKRVNPMPYQEMTYIPGDGPLEKLVIDISGKETKKSRVYAVAGRSEIIIKLVTLSRQGKTHFADMMKITYTDNGLIVTTFAAATAESIAEILSKESESSESSD